MLKLYPDGEGWYWYKGRMKLEESPIAAVFEDWTPLRVQNQGGALLIILNNVFLTPWNFAGAWVPIPYPI